MSPSQNSGSEPIGSELISEDASFADIVMQFVDGLGERLNKMEQAMSAADFESLRVAAHQLKGSGGGYGYPILTERAASLERQAKSKSLDACQTTLDELKQICNRIVPEAAK